MSGGIDFRIDANDTRLNLQLDSLPEQLRLRLKVKISELTHQLLRLVEAREPKRTGRLRSLTHAYVDDNVAKGFVRGRVRVLRTRGHNTAAAAAALEYGSTGRRFPVRAYRRRGGNVAGYSRRGGITELRFLRGPAAAMLPRARAELNAVILSTFKDELKP
jgi:hypothetical protein